MDTHRGAATLAARLGDWRADGGPLTGLLAAAIRDAVMDGRVSVGTELPSERELARTLRVSRGTVTACLARLRDDGWVETRHGSGSRVRLPARLTERTAPWSLDTETGLNMVAAVTAAPHEPYLAAVRRASDRFATLLLDDGTADGLPGLRELLASRYTRSGLATMPEQILITAGAQAALILVMNHFHDRRRPTLVENPTFPGALAVLRRHRARLMSVPVTAAGWDLDRLTDAVRLRRPGLAYLVPDFQNPTGALMPDRVRADVAALAERHDLTVVVDETMRDLDLRADPRPPPHLAGSAVITIGSTNKVIWGGLRVGWIRAAAATVQELRLSPLYGPLSPPPLEQLIAEDLLGDLDPILVPRRAQLRAQRDHLAGLLAGTPDWTYDVPPGGLALWLRLHATTARSLTARARTQGLLISPGPAFSADQTLLHHVRLPFTAAPATLTRAVTLLRNAHAARQTDRSASSSVRGNRDPHSA
jgi:DNA-binding transcriptional MocR family regulator